MLSVDEPPSMLSSRGAIIMVQDGITQASILQALIKDRRPHTVSGREHLDSVGWLVVKDCYTGCIV